jgi:aminomethyltransferase
VYAPDNTFSVAIARRVTADADPVLTKETTFHPRTSELTKSFVEYRGYWLPHCFDNEGAIAEYWACREKVAIMDLSPLRKWEILGPDAEALVQKAITRDARRLSVGQVTYTALCNETGGMIDDATVYRLGQDNFRFVGGDEYDGSLAEGARRPAPAESVGEAVDRPASQRRCSGTGEPGAPQEDRLDAADADVTRGPQVVPLHGRADRDVRRHPHRRLADGLHGRARLRGVVPPSDGPAVWDAIWSAGEGHGLTPLGLEALDILRIESGLIFAGYEFDDQVDPFEAGIGFAVDLRTDDDFVGARRSRSACAPAARARRARARGNETAGHGDESTSAGSGRRRDERHAQPDPQEEHRARRVACSTRSSERRSRSASSTGCRSGSRRTVVAFPSTTRTRRGRAHRSRGALPPDAGRQLDPDPGDRPRSATSQPGTAWDEHAGRVVAS